MLFIFTEEPQEENNAHSGGTNLLFLYYVCKFVLLAE